jgi:hypothetical protein
MALIAQDEYDLKLCLNLNTVQFGIVRQSRVTRASDVPKYRLCHMSQSLLTKG